MFDCVDIGKISLSVCRWQALDVMATNARTRPWPSVSEVMLTLAFNRSQHLRFYIPCNNQKQNG